MSFNKILDHIRWIRYSISIPALVILLLLTAQAIPALADAQPLCGTLLTAPDEAATFGSTWSPLANSGINGWVSSIALLGNDVYVGGAFAKTADGSVTGLNNIAKYSGGAWYALPNDGLNFTVNALYAFSNKLYVGGSFTGTHDGSIGFSHFAVFDGRSWQSLPHGGLEGIDAKVLTFAALGTDLYVGGTFTKTADGQRKNLNNIARLEDGIYWKALPHQGLNGQVNSMAAVGPDLYVGGGFNGTGDLKIPLTFYGARLVGGTRWQGLPNGGLAGSLIAIASRRKTVYFGGEFDRNSNPPWFRMYSIARLKDAQWHAFPHKGLDGIVYALAVKGKHLYVGGRFGETYDHARNNLGCIAEFDGTRWIAPPNGGLGVDLPPGYRYARATVYTLQIVGNDLYVGGAFSRTADGSIMGLNNIAKLTLQ